MPDWINRENAAIFLAGVSFALSVLAFWRQNRASGRAHFTAEWVSSHELGFVNHGPGPGRDVTVSFAGNDGPIDEPVPYMAARQQMKAVGVAVGDRNVDVQITWKDNRRRRQSFDVRLPPPPKYQWPVRQPDGSAVDSSVRAIVKAEIDDAFRRATQGF